MPDKGNATKWYEIRAEARSEDAPAAAEVFIYGNIGDRWDENGVIAAELVRDIAALDVETITLRINSYGGSVVDGIAIYNALKRHKAVINAHIDGVAISCAGFLAMAGDSLAMAANAQLMIHAPWTYAAGNAVELRAQADVLDRYARAMASAYADKSGKTIEACLALLTDGKDHWYSADEAAAEGFADAVSDPMQAAASIARSFDLSRFVNKPVAQSAATAQEANMPSNIQAPAAAPAAAPVVPFARTADMNKEVLALFSPFIARDGIQALQTEVLADPALKVEDIQARLLAKLGENAEPANPVGAHPRAEVVEDELDKRKVAASAAILARAGMADDKTRAALNGNPFRGAKLIDIARSSLERAGVRHAGMSQMEIVAAAFTQGTSDFPILLENAMHKSLQAAYAIAPLTWSRFCARGSVSDFRAHNRYQVGSFGNLDTVNELGEFVNKTVPDGQKGSITATTKGNVINLSRQAIINDDLGAFIGLSASLGRAAARTVEAAVYALLAQNSGLGPTVGSAPLFDATHGNVGASGALSVTTVEGARVLMASQTDVSGNDYLDLRPAVILVPMASGGTARVLNDAQYDPDTANKLQMPNKVRGLFRDVIDTPRLSGTRFYTFADPMEAPVLEVAFLDGQEEPYLELQNGFEVDGARYKVRLDFGVAALDWRGATTHAGA